MNEIDAVQLLRNGVQIEIVILKDENLGALPIAMKWYLTLIRHLVLLHPFHFEEALDQFVSFQGS
jgi:hypothetical protein